MKKFFFLLMSVPFTIMAQPTITNAENYSIGTILKLRSCSTAGVGPGPAGAAQYWDFSSLVPMPDTVTVQMLSPASVGTGSMFPQANLVEKWSDGRYVFTIKTAGASALTGFIDTVSAITIHYPDSMRFAIRPLSYGNMMTDAFTDHFTSGGFNFSGGGTCTIHADGYGTLVLPDGTHNNVLRVKVVQEQTDTIFPFMTTSSTHTTTYEWFDGMRTAPLLKIDSTHSSSFSGKAVTYLANEIVSSINKQARHTYTLEVFPNPVVSQAMVRAQHPLDNARVYITDIAGKVMMDRSDISGHEFTFGKKLLHNGIYCLHVQWTNGSTGTFSFVVTD